MKKNSGQLALLAISIKISSGQILFYVLSIIFIPKKNYSLQEKYSAIVIRENIVNSSGQSLYVFSMSLTIKNKNNLQD